MTTTGPVQPLGLGQLRGRVALVTGGTRGIGAAICHQLADEGASVAAGYWRHHEPAEKFMAGMTAQYPGRKVTVHHGNIGDADDCRRVVGEVVDQHGRLDILVNNAGITIDRTVAKMTGEDWQKVIAVNLSGAFFMAQAALEHMIERGTGRIVNMSSAVGEIGNIGQANYAASKSGLFGLTKSLAKEAIFQLNRAQRPPGDGMGLTVNAVTPGYTATDMLATIPGKCWTTSAARSPAAGSGSPKMSPGWSRSWPPTNPPTSPGRSGPSTADWTCERRSRRSHRGRVLHRAEVNQALAAEALAVIREPGPPPGRTSPNGSGANGSDPAE